VGGGLRGSTSGLRFNPREAPEFAEEDRNLGRDDPEGEQNSMKKKRRKEKRTVKRRYMVFAISMSRSLRKKSSKARG
jgi:hypothetical protein